MARANLQDFFQNFRFKVVESNNHLNAAAGFNTCTIPDLSLPEVTYREGTYVYTRKQPGIPEVGNVTLTRGVARQETDFFRWLKDAIEGKEYRTDVQIQHFHRSDQAQPAATYDCHECLIVRCKPAGDLAADSADISMEEMEFACESIEVNRAGGAGGTPSHANAPLVGANAQIRLGGSVNG